VIIQICGSLGVTLVFDMYAVDPIVSGLGRYPCILRTLLHDGCNQFIIEFAPHHGVNCVVGSSDALVMIDMSHDSGNCSILSKVGGFRVH
jgi:hypothetical protein